MDHSEIESLASKDIEKGISIIKNNTKDNSYLEDEETLILDLKDIKEEMILEPQYQMLASKIRISENGTEQLLMEKINTPNDVITVSKFFFYIEL